MTHTNTVAFHFKKACAEGNLAAVQAYAPQWNGLTYGKFLSTAVQSNQIAVVEYLLDLNNLPSEVARAMEYAVDDGFWDLLPVLAEYLDDYFCGMALERSVRLGKATAVALLAPFSPPHFSLRGLVHALTQKNDDIIDILAPLHPHKDVWGMLVYNNDEQIKNYYTQWVDNQHTRKVLTNLVAQHPRTDCVKRKI